MSDLIVLLPFCVLPVIWVASFALRLRNGNARTLIEPMARSMGWRR